MKYLVSVEDGDKAEVYKSLDEAGSAAFTLALDAGADVLVQVVAESLNDAQSFLGKAKGKKAWLSTDYEPLVGEYRVSVS